MGWAPCFDWLPVFISLLRLWFDVLQLKRVVVDLVLVVKHDLELVCDQLELLDGPARSAANVAFDWSFREVSLRGHHCERISGILSKICHVWLLSWLGPLGFFLSSLRCLCLLFRW